MINITVDISAVADLFNINVEEVNALRELVVKAQVQEAYANIVSLAKQRLNSTRNEYISALQVERENDYTYTISLKGSALANMLESGMQAFDMKDGFKNSSKIRLTKKGGWYLIIPFKFRTTSANPLSGQAGAILPRAIYDLIRSAPARTVQRGANVVSSINNAAIPQRFQQTTSVISELNNRADSYVPKTSIYTGLQRTQGANGLSTYNTFRVVSNKSNPMSWIHPGIQAYNLMEQATTGLNTDEIIYTAFTRLMDI